MPWNAQGGGPWGSGGGKGPWGSGQQPGSSGPNPPGYTGNHRSIPTWVSMRTTTWQYIEYYGNDNTTVAFREYYDLKSDPWELQNVLADNDPKNDPDVAGLSARLQRAEHCAGRAGPNPCP